MREGGLPGPQQRPSSTRRGAQRRSFILPLPPFLAGRSFSRGKDFPIFLFPAQNGTKVKGTRVTALSRRGLARR